MVRIKKTDCFFPKFWRTVIKSFWLYFLKITFNFLNPSSNIILLCCKVPPRCYWSCDVIFESFYIFYSLSIIWVLFFFHILPSITVFLPINFLQRLITFEALSCGAYWRAMLKRGGRLYKSKWNYSYGIWKLYNFLFHVIKKTGIMISIYIYSFFNILRGFSLANWLPGAFSRGFIFTSLSFINVLYILIFSCFVLQLVVCESLISIFQIALFRYEKSSIECVGGDQKEQI